MKSEKHLKEPLVRIVKRDSISRLKAWGIRFAAIGLALVVCAIAIYAVTKLNPVSVYKSMFDGAFGTSRRVWNTVRDAMILLLVALAVTPAFKMRFWNIGAEGQMLVGALATAAIMRYCADMPAPLMFTFMIVASMVAGLIWGIIPALFKAKWNTNETLFTLMMNYVATQLVAYFCILWEAKKGTGNVGVINQATRAGWIPTDFLSGIFGNFNYSIITIVVIVIAVLVYVYLTYTKQGYEIAVVGESENTARYAGINVFKVILRTMLISGAICGLAGFLVVSGSSYTVAASTAGGRGFTAIIVSWLAKFNAFAMVIISFMLVFFEKGAIQIASQFHLNESASDVITGIILFFILGCEFFINYRLVLRGKKEGK